LNSINKINEINKIKRKKVSRDPRARWDKAFVVVLLCFATSQKEKKFFSECLDPVQPSDVGADETVHRSIFAA
jgi:hypothetical protein